MHYKYDARDAQLKDLKVTASLRRKKMSNQEYKSEVNEMSKSDKTSGGGASTKMARDKGNADTIGSTANDPARGNTGNGEDKSLSVDNIKNKALDTAGGLLNQAKASAGGAFDAVTDKASSLITDQKSELSVGLTSVADTVRRVSGAIGEGDAQFGVTEYAQQYTETAAQKLETVAQYFERTDLKGMARDVESYARRNPAIFLGSAFALGILAARFIKSSPTRLTEGAGASLTPGGSRDETQNFRAASSTL